MLSKKAKTVLAYMQSSEGSYILRQADLVLKQNKIRVSDNDPMGIKGLILAHALYPQEVEQATGGLVKTADLDYCDIDDGWCAGNKKIPRFKMPVIEGKFLHSVVKNLKNGFINWMNIPKNPFEARYYEAENGEMVLAGNKTPRGVELYSYHERSANGDNDYKVKCSNPLSVPATSLKPTQSEINFEKSYGMAFGYLTNSFPGLVKYDPKTVSLVSKDRYIIDGHHRWAAIGLLNRYGKDLLLGQCIQNGENCSVDSPDHVVELLELVTKPVDAEITKWFKDAPKDTGKPNLQLPIIVIDLPVKDLVDVLNACTDSLGVARKPFDQKDKDKVVLPLDNYSFERVNVKEEESTPDDQFEQALALTPEYDENDPQHYIKPKKAHSLRSRLRNVFSRI
jgi:hypothetical protein